MSGGGSRDDDITQEVELDTSAKPREHGLLQLVEGPDPGLVIPVPVRGSTVLGRGEDADARLDDLGLSRRHARFFGFEGKFYVEDLGSTNGVHVEGARIGGLPHRLQHGDRIMMGESLVMTFQLHDEASKETSEKLYRNAVRDALTGLYNRRYLDERMGQERAHAVRHETPLSVMLIDLDRFKSVNDTHGHAAGDAVLRNVARVLAEAVRAEDVVARYGGEEMCVLARSTGGKGAIALAERLRRNIESLPVHLPGQVLRVTASFGIATFDGAEGAEKLLERADQALYAAKERGRNRCVHADDL